MKIYYISHRDILKGRVDPIQIMQTCYNLARLGHELVLVTPTYSRAENVKREEVWKHYGLDKAQFKIVMLPTFLRDDASLFRVRISKFVLHLLYAIKVLFDLIFRSQGKVVILSRCLISTIPYFLALGWLRRLKNIQFVFELHALSNTRSEALILHRMDGILCISNNLRAVISRRIGMPVERTAVVRVGVNLDHYAVPHSREALRAELNLATTDWIVMYTGKIAPEIKEIALLLATAKLTPEARFVFVGGREEAVEYWRNQCIKESIANVVFAGFVAPALVSRYQLAANILVLYYSFDVPTLDFMSPGKLMEYMATGNAIVAADFPVLREVLRPGANAILVPPEKPAALSAALRQLRQSPELCLRLGEQARKDVKPYSWAARAQLIAGFLDKLMSANPVDATPDGR